MKDKKFLEKLISIRREIHKYPELGNREFKTAGFVEKVLRSLRIPAKRITKTGVLATLSRSPHSSSRCIALRADMDALPLTETARSSYPSRNQGVMHACGHDAHVTMLLGAAMILSEDKDWSGTVKLFFQPNEEGAGGAKDMISHHAMKNPNTDAVIGLHVNPRLSTGTIGLKEGPLMAAVDKFTLEIIGEGGHAAYPHEGKDAVSITAEIVQSLQTIASRKVDPLEPLVLTIGTINGGSRFNILAEKVILTGTVRTLSEKVHRQIPKLIRQVVGGICQAHGAKFKLNYECIGSVLSNSKPAVKLAKGVAVKLFGKNRVKDLKAASMGGEDFAEYLKESPGCFIYVGCANKSLKTDYPWHHPKFNIDERAMPTGAKLLSGIAKKFLKSGLA